MLVSIIAAVAKNGVIGNNGKLPWGYIKDDMDFFREMTHGHAVIMGRKTWESIGYKKLDGRLNIVVSNKLAEINGGVLVSSLQEGLKEADKNHYSVFVIGGEEIYEEALDYANFVYLTRIHENYNGDKKFPIRKMNRSQWVKRNLKECKSCTFEVYSKL